MATRTRRRCARWGGGLAALVELKASGTVAAIGIGVNEVEVCLELLPRMDMDVILLAGRYTLLDRSAEARLLPALAGRDTRLVIGGLLNSGVLLPDGPQLFDYRPASDDVVARARRITGIVEARSHTVTDVAANFPLAHPSVASVLLGTTDVRSIRMTIASHGLVPDTDLDSRTCDPCDRRSRVNGIM